MRYIATIERETFLARLLLVENSQDVRYREGTLCCIHTGSKTGLTPDGPMSGGGYYPNLSIDQVMEEYKDSYNIPIDEWRPIPDQVPGCRDDWVAPVREKQGENGADLHDQWEQLIDEEWVELVTCKIVETNSWGAYAATPAGERILIPFGELSWSRVTTVDEVVSVGDNVRVALQCAPTQDRDHFLGSLRAIDISTKPRAEGDYSPGTIHEAEVTRIGQDCIFVELPFRVMVGIFVKDPSSYSLKLKEEVRFRVTGCAHEKPLSLTGELV